MRAQIYWISGVNLGRIGITSRPRGGDWLEEEIHSYCNSGIDVVVSLLTQREIVELELVEEGFLCEAAGLEYLSFPIEDRKVPPLNQITVAFIQTLAEFLFDKKSIVIHCRMGIGRAALIAACVLVMLGNPVQKAFENIATSRGCPVPDTADQYEWVVLLPKRYQYRWPKAEKVSITQISKGRYT